MESETKALPSTPEPPTQQFLPETPAGTAPGEHQPESPAPLSRRTGQPITQSEVDQLHGIIEHEVDDRSNFMRSLDRARTPLGLVHHGIGAYTVVCDDGTAWKLHGDVWEQFAAPIPGTRADLVAKLKAESDQRAQERAAAAATPPATPAATPGDNANNHLVAEPGAGS